MKPRSWLQVIGGGIALIGIITAAFLFVLETRQSNIYFSIISFCIMPAIIGGGVMLYGIGAWLERRRERKLGADYQPQINLALGEHRLAVGISLGIAAAILLPMSFYGSYQAVHVVSSDRFCATACHNVMEPEAVAHLHSPHASVSCTSCHIGPGAEHAIRAKFRGLHQLKAVLAGKFPRPVPSPVHSLRTPQDICGQCHDEGSLPKHTLKDYRFVLADDDNSVFQTRVLLKTAAIHAHPPTKYVADDPQRQTIPLVRVTRPDGSSETFTHEDEERAESAILAQGLRGMDCIDCHNRPAHRFPTPQQQINALFAAGKLPALPNLKEHALACFEADPSAFPQILSEAYGDSQAAAEIAKASDALAAAWRISHFPEMKVDWRSHPDNIGHSWSQGCFRCHDGRHESSAGKRISADCAICHDIVGQGPGLSLPPLGPPQTFKHPTDIAEMWQEMLCTECHNEE
ncbi:MAG: hypothetical protein ACI8W8_004766 [Rhodothermales bacterium]|jgi:hypothetical protein